MTDKINYQLVVPEDHAGERLDQALAKLMSDYSRTQIQDWIETGAILVDGKTTKGKTRLKGGEAIEVNAFVKPQPAWKAQDIHLNIVYEDEAVIIINKPVGLVVHPGAGNSDSTLLNALLHHAPELKDLPRAGILHRLDKDTSGLMVVAKTAKALKNLSQQLKKREILREYQAIVYGSMISGGTVNAPIERHHLQRKRMAVSDTGKPAVTHYRIAEKYRAHTRLKLQLETGRTHQIRVHMAHIRHPIVGDPTYGGRVQLTKNMAPALIELLRRFRRQALHAFGLGFIHPTTGEWVRWEIDLPEDMQQLVLSLRNDFISNPAD
ncbi:MAG: 23S rRNA pseudouridine(1911/1915/1917) synthase RluD [Gammaproteobacteria bacterium]